MVDSVSLQNARAALVRREWEVAATAFRAAGPAAELELGDQFRRNLACNCADLAQYRPEIKRLVDAAPNDQRFAVGMGAGGKLTVNFQNRPLSEDHDPVVLMSAMLQKTSKARHDGAAMGLFGSGDGYLITSLARHPVPLRFGQEHCIHFLEPFAANLVAAMTIHDWSGPTGPIQQKRFQWYVGADCVEQFRQAYIAAPGMRYPEVHIALGPTGKEIEGALPAVIRELVAIDQGLAEEVRRVASGVTLESLIDLTSRTPSRQPKALLFTTRYSTVLQYSTEDMAEGLRELGWQADVLIEPTPFYMLTRPDFRRAILATKPDLVIQLDHLRAEHRDIVPAEIPFVCWAQDHLPNLCDERAGRAMGERDFFMTCLGDWFVRDYAYPRESIVAAAKFTKVVEIPAEWESDGHDLTYVSNASVLPEVGIREYAARFEGVAKDIALGAAARVIEAYAQGKTFYGPSDLTAIVEGEALARDVTADRLPVELTVDLFERVNNLCYRQQALTWVADVADELGLELAIYGAGWEKHPRFAKYAQGHVQYGPALEKLTRASKINLQIVPYFCLHQRLLDGIAAGGFFLVRSHVSDSALPALCEYVEKHVPGDVRTYAEARQRLSPEVLSELDKHAAANSHLEVMLDVIQQARNAKAMGLFPENRPMPDRIEDVSFGSAAECRALVVRYLADAKLRREIAMQQRASTLDVLSYAAGIRRVLDSIHEKLAAKAKGLRVAA